MAEGKFSAAFDNFLENMHEIAEDISTLEENSKAISRLQQKVKGAATQNESDKDNLLQLREDQVQSGTRIKDELKKELDLLRQEELVAERSEADLLDEDNEIYIKRAKLMENYKRFIDSWDVFHRSQLAYLEDIRNKLTSRFKVVKENATEDEIEILLDPTKENHTNIILNETNMRPAEATDLKSRIYELNQLENFIGKTHNLKTHLEGLLTNQTGTKEPEEKTSADLKESCFIIKYLSNYGITIDRRTTTVSLGVLFVLILVIIIASSISSTEKPLGTVDPTSEPIITFTEPTIDPAPSSVH